MKLTLALSHILTLLVVSVSAAKRPEGAPDGIYLEIVSGNGTTIMEYVGPTPSTIPEHKLDRRAGVGPQCQSPLMALSDIQAAQGGLANFFGGGNAFYAKSVSSYSGSAVAYGCNYGNGQTMDSNTFNEFMSDLDVNCGNTHAGYYNHPDWKASYGRTQSSQSFC